MREQKDREGWLSLKKLHDKAIKAGPTKISSHHQMEHPQWHSQPLFPYAFGADSMPQINLHTAKIIPLSFQNWNKSLTKWEWMAGKTHSIPSSQKHSSGSGVGHNYQGPLNASERSKSTVPGLSKANGRSPWAFTEQGVQIHILVTTPCVNRIWRWFSFRSKQKLQRQMQ